MDETYEIIDIGVNLAHRAFQVDREQVIGCALAAGVRQMIITGTNLRNSQEALRIARAHPGQLFITAGVHPHDSRNCTTESLAQLSGLTRMKEVVAVGECGLDFNRDFSPRPVQEQCFEAQLALAGEVQLPLFLHERDAHRRFLDIMAANRGDSPAVVHCFTGTREEVKAYLELGCYIGITGWICDERRGVQLRELVRYLPLDRLMIETDAPFLLPRTMAPKPADGRNEPAFLPYVLRAVAGSLNKTVSEVASATTRNAKAFFRIA